MKTSKDNMIHIGLDWAIQGDEFCWTLYKRRVTKKGSAQWDAKGYYISLNDLLKRLVSMDIGPVNNLAYVAQRQDELQKHIDNICEKLAKSSINECSGMPFRFKKGVIPEK